jgi:hypothetical protein
VTLQVRDANGLAVFTERDIEAVRSGRAVWEIGQELPRRTIFIAVSPSAAERLREFTSEHLGERLILDFNGELETEITIGGVIEARMALDVTGLDMTLEEFEQEYLTD